VTTAVVLTGGPGTGKSSVLHEQLAAVRRIQRGHGPRASRAGHSGGAGPSVNGGTPA
jgi:hypothetical protein